MSLKISVGIVTYNNADTIYKCIDSILEHSSNVDFNLYVYDNGSRDGTIEIIQKNFPKVQLILGNENIGFGSAHNRIVKVVKSDVHVIVNPDVFIVNDVFVSMADYMEKHGDVVQITPQIRNLDDSIQHLPKKDPSIKYVILSKFKPSNYNLLL